MKIEDLKRIIKHLPQDADIIMQKHTTGRLRIFAPVLGYRITMIKDKEGCLHKRLVLINDKELKETL